MATSQLEAGAMGAASGAMQGAQYGKILGPKGAAAGAAIGAVVGGIRRAKGQKDADRANNYAIDDPDQLASLRQSQREYKSLQTGTSGVTQQNVAQQQGMTKAVASRAGKSQGGLSAMLSTLRAGQAGTNQAFLQGQQQAAFTKQGIDQTISEMGAKRHLENMRRATQAIQDAKQQQSNAQQTIGAFAGSSGAGGGNPFSSFLNKQTGVNPSTSSTVPGVGNKITSDVNINPGQTPVAGIN